MAGTVAVIGVPKPRRIVDYAFRDFVRQQPCLLAGEEPCTCGPYISAVSRRIVVEAAHVRGVGAGGSDPENLIPLCAAHHHKRIDSLHRTGRDSFAASHWDALGGRTLRQVAKELWRTYTSEVRDAR